MFKDVVCSDYAIIKVISNIENYCCQKDYNWKT